MNTVETQVNLVYTLAKTLLVVAFLAVILINDPIKPVEENGPRPKAEFVMVSSWQGGDNDIDTWVEDPENKIIFYGKRESGLTFLDRDDLGTPKYQDIDGKFIEVQEHYETLTIRGNARGEYIVNLHLFRSGPSKESQFIRQQVEPIPVKFVLYKVNPTFTELYQKQVFFEYVKQEIHIVRFSINEYGYLENIRTDLPKSIYERVIQR